MFAKRHLFNLIWVLSILEIWTHFMNNKVNETLKSKRYSSRLETNIRKKYNTVKC